MGPRLITPDESFWEGIIWSTLLGVVGAILLSVLLKLSLGTGLPGMILFLPTWLVLGFTIFGIGRLEVPFQMSGVGLTFGNANGDLYAYGKHWVFRPFKTLMLVPGPNQEFSVQM